MHEFSPEPSSESRLRHALFAAAAFGADPRAATAELPTAADGAESWLRAVALGGQGRYAAARAELRRTRLLAADSTLLTSNSVVRSLADSAEASLLRQLGWHARAAVLDGRALAGAWRAAAGSGPDDRVIDTDVISVTYTDSVCDALTGLAADALGTARPTLAARLLERCRRSLDASGGWRTTLRWHWVSAETALAAPGSGLLERSALEQAAAAVAIAERHASTRHSVKSRLLLAAAAAANGDLDRSAELAATVARQCDEHGLLPLRWASAMLRGGVETGSAATRAAAEAAECAAELAVRGGRLRSATGVLGGP
ncbi:hypothetical protein [Nocardia macrotermitis]|uniref:Uncharacterized protein n=1 Tax=Nocardia macrotermitis TaxID=2585198 RepID=A0A7K0D1A7_9NOCA|nr:hypothetical protein [Nocardia macrotermitis]MQY19012.1 hypothetical protein [Nocardia macrotermitis]